MEDKMQGITEAGAAALEQAARNAMAGPPEPTTQQVDPNMGFEDPEKLVAALEQMHRSRAYLIMRDHITQRMETTIRKAGGDLQKRFAALKRECKDSWEYDHKFAMMCEVNRGLTNLYGIILNILSAHQNVHQTELDAIHRAINNIEERLDIEKTDWNGGEDNDASGTGDVPPVQADSGGTE